jgi:hypothetical protein
LLAALPTDIRALSAVVRNVIVHYRGAGITFTGERLDEINSRWIERILDVDQGRHASPVSCPRVEFDRVAGCCRDFTLLTVAALRQHGIPARSRIGFASYLEADFQCDHVIVEHWDGDGWRFTDAQLEPDEKRPFDSTDLPSPVGAKPGSMPPFATAATVWTAYRKGEIDINQYGVDPTLPIRGASFVRNYVISELAHRQRDELLLWDGWGAMGGPVGDALGDLDVIDDVAALLLAADAGDDDAERDLSGRYATDARLRPGTKIRSYGLTGRHYTVDLDARLAVPA